MLLYYYILSALAGTGLVILGQENRPPHILLILADDMGWNDVGFNNPNMVTPTIDQLANEGVILNQSYVLPTCSPSRSALLTGVYPFKTGSQHLVWKHEQPACLDTNVTLLPQKLRDLGYATHAIGKWHLGFCRWECTPTFRGFDSFYGFYNGGETYYTHETLGGYDFRDNIHIDRKANNTYSTFLFAERAVRIIEKHDPKRPLFLYVPFQSPHSPLQVPSQYEEMCNHVKLEGRRKYCGVVAAMDEAIGNITQAFRKARLWDKTLTVFSSDNGGMPSDFQNNYPLRGAKATLWEGGTRAVGFMRGSMLTRTGYRYDGLVHITDWFPTLLAAAGAKTDVGIDGIDLWAALRDGSSSPRTEFIYNIDHALPPACGYAAIRVGDYKYIEGLPGFFSGWYRPDEPFMSYSRTSHSKFEVEVLEDVYRVGEIQLYMKRHRLYHIKDDPTERRELSLLKPGKVRELKERLEFFKKHIQNTVYPDKIDNGHPVHNGGVWGPGWC